MADIVRLGTDLNEISDPGRDVRPANDYLSRNVTMAVDVQKGQVVALNTSALGVLADASTGQPQRIWGVATEKVAAGKRVACVYNGKMSGFDFAADTDLSYPVYLSDTAGEMGDAAGTVSVLLGRRCGLAEIFVNIVP
jgi:hypothetical protein